MAVSVAVNLLGAGVLVLVFPCESKQRSVAPFKN